MGLKCLEVIFILFWFYNLYILCKKKGLEEENEWVNF